MLTIKDNDVFHTRLIVYDYSKVAGVDFSKNYLLVMNDVMVRMLLLIMINFEFMATVVNAETAFLCGEKEMIYMECPSGMNDICKDACVILQNCTYCLVQAARQYNNKARLCWRQC